MSTKKKTILASKNTKTPPLKSAPRVARTPDQQQAELESLASQLPYNNRKNSEYGDASKMPLEGEHIDPPSPLTVASSLSELNDTGKTGVKTNLGVNAMGGRLDAVRIDNSGQRLTTNHGVPIADNQHSLKAGHRGPALLKDFILREKITHFDHERIPERIVHARGSGAHGYFEAYDSLSDLTRAAPFQKKGLRTPVFVRFSTVAGERGSKDTARDVRGFAVKFYTTEGNWDLVGNNMPVFFIQDAMKFPDLVHAVKPEPHHGMPQAASAHDTFWDFVSLMPESTHMLLWAMSDRGIPRSYRMMQGFGVHTFRLVNENDESVLVKFHWNPVLGTHSHVWDEAVKISGADPDYHRRDLWEAIESGEYPEWELGLQIFTEKEAAKFSFDVLDATKLIPEEMVPVRPVGRMVLNRNPDNFFAETEQVAFCTAHVIPGIDFTNDPLLAGRIHSYVDTQISRLGGPNFHEIPINAPLAAVHNNQRDGMHRQAIARGAVAYEPNSLGGGCPFQTGHAGFRSFPEPVTSDELRGAPEKFAEHFNQATLFFNSQSAAEQAHIAAAFRFELSKVRFPAIRQRVLSMLRNVSDDLAQRVAAGLGASLPEPMPRATTKRIKPEVQNSRALSLNARKGNGGVRSRKVAILVADGVDAEAVIATQKALVDSGAVASLLGPRIGTHKAIDGSFIVANASIENEPLVLFDGVVIPGGENGIIAMVEDARFLEHLRDQYRHGKTILAIAEGTRLLDLAGISVDMGDRGVLRSSDASPKTIKKFIHALGEHRHPERETDPPRV